MYSFSTRYVLVFRSILCLTAWIALILQCSIVLTAAARDGISIPMALGNFLSYFTILTNGLIAFSLGAMILFPHSRWGQYFALPAVQSAIAGCIVMVSLIYHVSLAKAWNPQGLQWVTNFLLHDVIPLLYVFHWLLLVPKGTLTRKAPFQWMIYPLIYLFIMLLRGACTGFYPYPFVNVHWHGYTRVLENVGVLVLGFFILFQIVIVIDIWMWKHFDNVLLKK